MILIESKIALCRALSLQKISVCLIKKANSVDSDVRQESNNLVITSASSILIFLDSEAKILMASGVACLLYSLTKVLIKLNIARSLESEKYSCFMNGNTDRTNSSLCNRFFKTRCSTFIILLYPFADQKSRHLTYAST